MNVNFNPLINTETLIGQIYPQEKIISSRWGLDWKIFTFIKIGFLPVGGNFLSLIPKIIRVIESDHYYFIDSRKFNHITFIPILLVGGIIYYTQTQIVLGNNLHIFLTILSFLYILIFISIIPSFLLQTWQTRVIKKSWLTRNELDGNKLFLQGNIPQNSQNFLTNNSFYKTGSLSEYFTEFFYYFK